MDAMHDDSPLLPRGASQRRRGISLQLGFAASILAIVACLLIGAFNPKTQLLENIASEREYVPPGEVLPYRQSAFRQISGKLQPTSKPAQDSIINALWREDAANQGEFGDGGVYGQQFGDHGLSDANEAPSSENKRNGWQLAEFQRRLSELGMPENITSGLQRLGIDSFDELQAFNTDEDLPSFDCGTTDDPDLPISGHKWCGQLAAFATGDEAAAAAAAPEVPDVLSDKSLPQPNPSLLAHLEEPDDLASADDWPDDFANLTEEFPTEIPEDLAPQPAGGAERLWWADLRANLTAAQIRRRLRAVDSRVRPLLATMSGERPWDDRYFYCYSISGEDPEFSQCMSDMAGADDPRTGRSIAPARPWAQLTRGLWAAGADGEPVGDDDVGGDAVPPPAAADGPVMAASWRSLTRGLWGRHGARDSDPVDPRVNFGDVHVENNGLEY